MNMTAFHVAPEDVMALLDGELSTSEASALTAHLEDCAECAQIAQQFRAVSKSLSSWKTPKLRKEAEELVIVQGTTADSGHQIRKPGLFIRASFWSWKQYAWMAVAAMSMLLIGVSFLTQRQAHQTAQVVDIGAYMGASKAEHTVAGGAGGTRDRLLEPRASATPLPSNGLQDVLREPESPAPMIARTESLSIVVTDFANSRSSLDMILTRYHGYSAELNVSTTENTPRSLQASLRIPAAALASALSDLKKLGRVERETQSGEEVTRQHQDLVARLKNSRDTEQRLREILRQRTGKITDVLKVEEEIARVRGEIEEMEAEQQSLEHRVNFAAVELQLAEEYKAQLNSPAPSISTRFHNSVVAGYKNVSETVLDILLFFTEYGPVIILWLAVLASPILFFWRRYNRINRAM